MDIVFKPSGGWNLVFQPPALPRYYPPATTHPVVVEVYYRRANQAPGESLLGVSLKPGSQGVIPYSARNDGDIILSTISYSSFGVRDVPNHEDAIQATLTIEYDTTPVAGIDAHVPTVTLPPTVAQAGEGIEELIVFTPAPDANAATLKLCQVKVEKADDASVSQVWGFGVAPHHRVKREAYPCKIYYRWMNQSAEDIGGGRGWSAWSPSQDAAESGVAITPVSEMLPTVVFDDNDSLAPIRKEIIL